MALLLQESQRPFMGPLIKPRYVISVPYHSARGQAQRESMLPKRKWFTTLDGNTLRRKYPWGAQLRRSSRTTLAQKFLILTQALAAQENTANLVWAIFHLVY